MSNFKEKYYSLTDIQKGKGGWEGGNIIISWSKSFGWRSDSGTGVSLTSQSRNHEPGSAKAMKKAHNGFTPKFILSLFVCLDVGTSQLHTCPQACMYFYASRSICMHYTIDYPAFTEHSEFCQLVLFVYDCCYVCLSKSSERTSICSVALILQLQTSASNTYVPATTSGQSAHPPPVINYEKLSIQWWTCECHYVSYVWTFWRQVKKSGKWDSQKITLNEYSDCTHYEARRCTCKENSTSWFLLVIILLLVN